MPESDFPVAVVEGAEVADYSVSHSSREGDVLVWSGSCANPAAKLALAGSGRRNKNYFVAQ